MPLCVVTKGHSLASSCERRSAKAGIQPESDSPTPRNALHGITPLRKLHYSDKASMGKHHFTNEI